MSRENEVYVLENRILKKRWEMSVTDTKIQEESSEFCEDYKAFLNHAKTERETVKETVSVLKKHGFREYRGTEDIKPYDRIFRVHKNKAVIAAVIGKKGCREGARIVTAHTDSPRIDVRPDPLYEEAGMGLLKTHYYGMIKKYQWVTIPLALHGVVAKENGDVLHISIGEKDGEPRFCISDLLPHLSKGLPEKTMKDAVTGEHLNVLAGSYGIKSGDGTVSVIWQLFDLLKKKYDITEEDFMSADLSFVPAFRADDIGLDRSMIGAYGQDDKVCLYPALMALIGQTEPENTCVLVMADKEEVGNGSTTGMNSRFFDYFMEDLAEREDMNLRDVFLNSIAVSADVSSVYDPNYPEAFEKTSSAYINGGVILQKYSGKEGKTDTNETNAEYLAFVRRAMNETGVIWQIGELGKIDVGGGSTLSKCISKHCIDVVDLGVPLLSMHSPYEVTAKNDIYMFYKGIDGFFRVKR